MSQILVGDKECCFHDLVEVIYHSPTSAIVSNEWQSIARLLGVNNVEQQRLAQNLLIRNDYDYKDLFYDIFQIWRSNKGNEATLGKLVHIFELLKLNNTAAHIREKYNFPSTPKLETASQANNVDYVSVSVTPQDIELRPLNPVPKIPSPAPSTTSVGKDNCSLNMSRKTYIYSGISLTVLIIIIAVIIAGVYVYKKNYEYKKDQLNLDMLRELRANAGALGTHPVEEQLKPEGTEQMINDQPNPAPLKWADDDIRIPPIFRETLPK